MDTIRSVFSYLSPGKREKNGNGNEGDGNEGDGNEGNNNKGNGKGDGRGNNKKRKTMYHQPWKTKGCQMIVLVQKETPYLNCWQRYLHKSTLDEFFPDTGDSCSCPWLRDTTYYVMAKKICEVFARLVDPATEVNGDGLGIPSDFTTKYKVDNGEQAFRTRRTMLKNILAVTLFNYAFGTKANIRNGDTSLNLVRRNQPAVFKKRVQPLLKVLAHYIFRHYSFRGDTLEKEVLETVFTSAYTYITARIKRCVYSYGYLETNGKQGFDKHSCLTSGLWFPDVVAWTFLKSQTWRNSVYDNLDNTTHQYLTDEDKAYIANEEAMKNHSLWKTWQAGGYFESESEDGEHSE